MSKRILANLVVFVAVFLVMCVWAVRNVVTFDVVERPYELDIDLQAASGLAPGAEVAYLGVNYGRVGDIELVEGGVRATLKIDDGREIPRGSIARVFRKSAIGEPYIDFQPPGDFDFDGADEDDFYQPGDVVPVDDTENPIEFSELLRTASALISEIEPERAATLLHELALALDGRGDDLREMTEASDTLAATFAERTDALDRLAENNTRLTRVLAERRTAFGQTVTDLAALAESLRNASGDTQVLLDRGTQLLAEVGDLVSDARPSLDCVLGNLVTVNDRAAAPAQLDNLALHLDIGPAAYAQFATTQDIEADGPWVRVNLTSQPENPAPQYEPPLELPPVPAVAPCPGVRGASSSTPTPATDFRPADVLASPGATALPATGAGVAASGAVVAALAAFAVGRATRRAR